MSGDRLAQFQENIDRANESGELVVVIGVDFAQDVLNVAKAARAAAKYVDCVTNPACGDCDACRFHDALARLASGATEEDAS